MVADVYEDIHRVTKEIKCYATYLQTRDCDGVFDKDAIALMDASASIMRNNGKLRDKRIREKQKSGGRQTSIIPFSVAMKK